MLGLVVVLFGWTEYYACRKAVDMSPTCTIQPLARFKASSIRSTANSGVLAYIVLVFDVFSVSFGYNPCSYLISFGSVDSSGLDDVVEIQFLLLLWCELCNVDLLVHLLRFHWLHFLLHTFL